MNAHIQWLNNSASGQLLLATENAFLSTAIQNIYGQAALQLGCDYPSVIELAATRRRIWAGNGKENNVRCDIHQLPFAHQIIDGIVLPHTLDWAPHPKQVLHEVYRVLKPGGQLIITGFNPYSLWAISRLWNRKILPYRRDCIALKRLKDWLDLLGFDIIKGCFMIYTPLLNNHNTLKKINFLQHAGNRWWPHGASIYGLIAIKRVHQLHPLKKTWQQENNTIFNPALISTSYKPRNYAKNEQSQ